MSHCNSYLPKVQRLLSQRANEKWDVYNILSAGSDLGIVLDAEKVLRLWMAKGVSSRPMDWVFHSSHTTQISNRQHGQRFYYREKTSTQQFHQVISQILISNWVGRVSYFYATDWRETSSVEKTVFKRGTWAETWQVSESVSNRFATF